MSVIQDTLREDSLTFNFPPGSTASKYDAWSHYRNQFSSHCGGHKAVDLVFVERGVAWLIEVKDYRVHPRTKTIGLADEIALKVRDTLAGLVSAQFQGNIREERDFAKALLAANKMRVVFHLEQPAKHSRLRPRVIEPDKLEMQLRSKIKWIDPRPRVVDRRRLRPDMSWTVTT